MFFLLSKILDVFLTPYFWVVALFALAIPWRASSVRSWKRRRVLGLAGLVAFVAFSFEPLSNALLWKMEHDGPATYREGVTYDAVILLGGLTEERAMAESGQPAYNDNVERLVMTHRLLRDGKAKLAIVSGGASDPAFARFGEARVMMDQLRDWGIDADRILIEDQSRNTRENAVYVAEIAKARGFSNVLLVTSAFHMKRAAECFYAVGMNVDTFPVDYRAHSGASEWIPRAGYFATSSAMIRELFGRLIYRARGYATPREAGVTTQRTTPSRTAQMIH